MSARLVGMAIAVVVLKGITGATQPQDEETRLAMARRERAPDKEGEGRKGKGGVDPQTICKKRLAFCQRTGMV